MPSGKRPRYSPPRPRTPLEPLRERVVTQGVHLLPGEVARSPRVTPRTLEEIGVKVQSTGLIEWPRYRTTPEGVEPLPESTIIRGFSRAERREMHRYQSVLTETARLHNVATELVRIHNYILQKGVPKSEELQSRLRTKLEELSARIGKKPTKKTPKRRTKVQIANAIELAGRNNPTALLQSLKGAVWGIGKRLSVLNKHHRHIERSRRGAVELRKRYQALGKERLREIDVILTLPRGKKFTRATIEQFARAFSAHASSYAEQQLKDPTPEGRELAARYQTAAEYLRNYSPTIRRPLEQQLVAIQQLVYTRYARNFIIPSNELRSMETWPIPRVARIASFQLKLFSENMEHWVAMNQTHWMSPWLISIANVLARGGKYQDAQKSVVRVSGLLKNRSPAEASAILERAIEELN